MTDPAVQAAAEALFTAYPLALESVADFIDEATVAVAAARPIITHLEPAENMALTVALAQVKRGDPVSENIAAACVLALARITRGTP